MFVLAVCLLASACALEPRNWADFTRQLRSMDPADRSAAVERYLAAHGGTPLVENQSRLIFVVQDVNGITPRIVDDFNAWALRLGSGQALRQDSGQALRQGSGPASTPPGADAPIGTPTRIDGTAWSYLESTAWTNARVEYVLLFEASDGAAKGSEARPDPLNPRLVQAYAGPHAEVRMPLWVAQPEIDNQTAVPPGELIAETFASRALGGTRRVWYYLPPGYDPSADTLYPVIYVLDGGNYIEKMDVPRVLDRLIASKTIVPVIAVFSEPGDRQEEYSRNPKWRAFITSELVPLVDKRFRTFSAPDHRVILGSSFAAYGAVDLAIEFPSVFGLCAAIAPPDQTATIVANQPNARLAARSIRFFVLGGLYDSLIGGARRLRTTLDGADAAVTYLEVSEGHSTETFRGHLDDAIKALLAER